MARDRGVQTAYIIMDRNIQHDSLHVTVNVIFRPYGRKLSLKFRYFPSVRTEILTHIYAIFRPYGRKFTAKFRYFPSVWTEIKCYNSLFSVRKSLISLTFRPQKT